MTRHTPGPWGYDSDSKEIFSSADDHCCGWIALIGGNDTNGRAYPADTREANARLIAAAPELLAALRQCADRLGEMDCGPELEAARAAIAKAESTAMACLPGVYAVELYRCGEEQPEIDGQFRVTNGGSVEFWTLDGWVTQRFAAQHENAESIGALMVDKWTEKSGCGPLADGDRIAVERLPVRR